MMPASIISIFSILAFHGSTLAQKCAVNGHFAGQNLAIADISGSTPTHYPDTARKPQPSTATAWACIKLPEHRALQAGTWPNNVEPQSLILLMPWQKPNGSVTVARYPQNLRAIGRNDGRQVETPPCKANTLLFARGTIPDWGVMGSVGDALVRGLSTRQEQADKWSFEDVRYRNDGSGFSCYGLPGGVVALGQLNALGNRCKDTKIVFGGFSQGAMVARIAVANAEPSVKDRVAAVVTFGDPFVGAHIRGFDGSGLKVSCANGDNICNACFNRKPGNHSGYAQSEWIEPAVDFILQRIGNK